MPSPEPVVESAVVPVMQAAVVPVVHVERTDRPEVLRWVCTSPSLAGAPHGARRPPVGGVLAAALADGSLQRVAVSGEGLLVTAGSAVQWPELVAPVHAAVVAALATRDGWLFEPTAAECVEDDAGAPTVAELQRIVDAAAGAITQSHGGTITVVAADAATATLRLEGACHGCRLSDDTVLRLVEPAVRRHYPQMTVRVGSTR